MAQLSETEMQVAFNQMAGEMYATMYNQKIQQVNSQTQMLSQLLSQMQQTMSASAGAMEGLANPVAQAGENDVYLASHQQPLGGDTQPIVRYQRVQRPTWATWMQGMGLGSKLSGNGNAGGMNYNLGGTMFGAHRWLGDHTMFGLTGGYTYAGSRDTLVPATSRNNDYTGGIYGLYSDDGQYLNDGFYFMDVDTYTGGSYTATRNINVGNLDYTATGNPNTNQWLHYNELGLTYQNGYNWWLQPFAGVQYVYYKQNGFTESGAGPLSLSVNSQSVNSLRPSLGIRFYKELHCHGMRVVPVVSGRYQHECADGTPLITSSFVDAPTVSFNTAGATLGRDFGLFNLGGFVEANSHLSLYGSCDTQVSQNYTSVGGTGGMLFRW
jgi:uncharacterized protein with beta-barrel porin domain